MLPDWIELPAPRDFVKIDWDSRFLAFLVTPGENGRAFESFDNIYDAYEYCKDLNFEITDAAVEAAGGERSWLGITVPSNNNRTRLLIELNDIERWDMLQNDFHDAVYNIRTWRENPSLDNAYWMLDTHPAFWTRHREEPTWEWKIDGHTKDFWFARGDGCWMMEAGGHTDDLMHKFHDLRLDVYEDTFENCILKMAELVDKFFHEDGTEREGVES